MKKMKWMMSVSAVALMAATAARAGEAANAVTANATNRFEVAGMHCDGCAQGLTAEFKSTSGVVAAQVTFSNKLAVVVFDTNRVNTAKLIKVADEAGYQAKPVKP
jgi:copper chaperone CopZ